MWSSVENFSFKVIFKKFVVYSKTLFKSKLCNKMLDY